MKRIYIEYDESKAGGLHLEVRDCTVKEISSVFIALGSQSPILRRALLAAGFMLTDADESERIKDRVNKEFSVERHEHRRDN